MSDPIPAGVGRYGGSPVFLLGILVLAAGTVAGITASLFVEWLEDDYDAELVELSVAILAETYEPDNSDTYRIRQFALDALERATGTDIPQADRESWLTGEMQALPAGFCAPADG